MPTLPNMPSISISTPLLIALAIYLAAGFILRPGDRPTPEARTFGLWLAIFPLHALIRHIISVKAIVFIGLLVVYAHSVIEVQPQMPGAYPQDILMHASGYFVGNVLCLMVILVPLLVAKHIFEAIVTGGRNESQ